MHMRRHPRVLLTDIGGLGSARDVSVQPTERRGPLIFRT